MYTCSPNHYSYKCTMCISLVPSPFYAPRGMHRSSWERDKSCITYPFWFLQCLLFEQLEALICRRNRYPLWWPLPFLGTAEFQPGARGCVRGRRGGSLGDGHRGGVVLLLLLRSSGRGRWSCEGGENRGSRLLLDGLLRGSHCWGDTQGRLDSIPCDKKKLCTG